MQLTSVPLINKFVSSANKLGSSSFETLPISLTYNIHNHGPNIDPCRTPHVGKRSDMVSAYYQQSFRHLYPAIFRGPSPPAIDFIST